MSERTYTFSNGDSFKSSAPEGEMHAWAAEEGITVVSSDPVVSYSIEGEAPEPSVAPSVGRAESAARGFAGGASAGVDDNAYGLGASLATDTPRTAGRGVDAPLQPVTDSGFTEARREYRSNTNQAAENHPEYYYPALFAGAATSAAITPQAKAAQGAGMVGKGAVGAANIGLDAVVGGVSGAGFSERDDLAGIAEDAKNDALIGGGAGALMRGVAHAPGAIARGARSAANKSAEALAVPYSADVADNVRKFTREPGTSSAKDVLDTLKPQHAPPPMPQGQQARAAAVAGADADGIARQLHGDLRAMEDVSDLVFSEASIRLKPGKLAPRFAADGVADSTRAMDEAFSLVDATMESVEGLKSAGRIPGMGSGSNAIALLEKAHSSFIEATRNIAEGPEGVAQAYAALDQFKRHLGTAAKKAGKGQMSDSGASHSLNTAYQSVRGAMEDAATWGPSAVEFQQTTNRAWSKAIPSMRELSGRFGSRHAKQSVTGNDFMERALIGSEQTAGVANKLGTAGNVDAESAIRRYAENQPELLRVLSEFYEVSPDVVQALGKGEDAMSAVLGVLDDSASNSGAIVRAAEGGIDPMVSNAQDAAKRVSSTLDTHVTNATAARTLGDIKADAPGTVVSPSPATPIAAVGKAERWATEKGLPAAERAAVDSAHLVSRFTAAAQPGMSHPTMSDKVQSLAASDPGQLGPYGASLNNALQMGRDHFVAYHSTLQQTDPGYQRLLRQLEETEHE